VVLWSVMGRRELAGGSSRDRENESAKTPVLVTGIEPHRIGPSTNTRHFFHSTLLRVEFTCIF
jgi:hypothetical protein